MAQPNPEQEHNALIGAHMQRLISTQEWDCLLQELGKLEQGVLESLATIPPDVIRYDQGVLHGIRQMKHLPERLIARGRRP